MDAVKTLITFSGYDEGHFHLVDTIWHDNAWWLVATWLQDPSTGHKTPERIVRLDGLRYQEVQGQAYRFVLSSAIPIAVFEGTPHEGYEVAYFPVLVDIPATSRVH